MVNVNKVYEFDNWTPNQNKLPYNKNCLSGSVKLTRNTIKSKFSYNSYGIGFDGAS